MKKISKRSNINSFIVMDIVARANKLEKQGHKIYHLEVGQPSVKQPKPLIEKIKKHLDIQLMTYSDSNGLRELRERIALYYQENFNTIINPNRIFVTSGTSIALGAVATVLFDANDKIALGLPTYAAYPNILKSHDLEPVFFDAREKTDFKITQSSLEKAYDDNNFQGLFITNPGNPTGTILNPHELEAIIAFCQSKNIHLISDEIYQNIHYDFSAPSACFNSDVTILNGMSKFFAGPGFRLGWVIVPDGTEKNFEAYFQNNTICAPLLSQYAALYAFDYTDYFQEQIHDYAEKRDILLKFCNDIGLKSHASADGAFYIYVNIRDITDKKSIDLCRILLEEYHVAITPGIDFDPIKGDDYIRFSYAGNKEDIKKATEIMQDYFKNSF